MIRPALLLAALLAAASSQAEVKIHTGQFRYLADAGLFDDCLTGDRWPVAQKAANAELERVYLEQQQAGEPLWVKVEGEVQRKLDLVAGKRRTFFVVHKVLESGIRDCDAVENASLENTQWMLVELGGRKVPSGKRRDPYLMLQKDSGKARGYGGCNHFMATYTLGDGTIEFGPVGSTRMHCQSGYELEAAYLGMLQQANRWEVRGRLLNLYDAEGKRIARFATGNP